MVLMSHGISGLWAQCHIGHSNFVVCRLGDSTCARNPRVIIHMRVVINRVSMCGCVMLSCARVSCEGMDWVCNFYLVG